MTTEEKLKLAQHMLERHRRQEAIEEREHVSRLMAASMHKEAEAKPQELWPGQAIIDLTIEIEALYGNLTARDQSPRLFPGWPGGPHREAASEPPESVWPSYAPLPGEPD